MPNDKKSLPMPNDNKQFAHEIIQNLFENTVLSNTYRNQIYKVTFEKCEIFTNIITFHPWLNIQNLSELTSKHWIA